MDTFYLITLPTILIVIPTIIQIVLTAFRIFNRSKYPIWLIAILTSCMSFLMGIIGTIISLNSFPDNVECLIGGLAFLYYGFITSITAQPIIGIIGGLFYWIKSW